MPQPKDKDWLNGYKNKTAIYILFKRPTRNKGHIQTESEGLEKDIPPIETKRKQEQQYSYQVK